MWFLRIAEELSNVVPANRYVMWFLQREERSCESQRSYLMWLQKSNVVPAEELLSNVVPVNRRGAI